MKGTFEIIDTQAEGDDDDKSMRHTYIYTFIFYPQNFYIL